MHEARINNTIINIPSKWDELQRRDLELIAGLSLMGCQEMMLKTQLLFYIAGISLRKTKSRPNLDDLQERLYQVKLRDSSTAYLSSAQVAELGNLFDFLFHIVESDEGKKSIHIDSQLTKNLVPSFKVGGTIYYGPADRLFNITLSEFIHAETNLTRYSNTKEIQYLDNLIAILYRPQKNIIRRSSSRFDGDRRTPFNDHKFEKRASKIRKLNHNIKICIYLFYQGCQWWYQQRFPHVFSHKKSSENNGLGFLNLVDALAGDDVTLTEKIPGSYLMQVMVHLERAAIEYENLEEKLNHQ
jgi:hypothetical protein